MDIDDKEFDTIKEKINVKKELYIPIDIVIKKLGLNMTKRDILSISEKHDFRDEVFDDDNFENLPIAGIVIGTKQGNMNFTRTKEKPKDDLPTKEKRNIQNNRRLLSRRKKQ